MMFLTASKKGLAERMNITDTALAFELISSKKPGATLADAPPVIIKITETPLSFAESNDLDKIPPCHPPPIGFRGKMASRFWTKTVFSGSKQAQANKPFL